MKLIGIILIVLLVVIIFCLDQILKSINGAVYNLKQTQESVSDIKIIFEKFSEIDLGILKEDLDKKERQKELLISTENLFFNQEKLAKLERELASSTENNKTYLESKIQEVKKRISEIEVEIYLNPENEQN